MKKAGVFLFVAVCMTAVTYAVTYNVPGDYATINAAIDAAIEDDTITVDPGIYPESVNFDGKDLILIGDEIDPSNVVIQANGFTYGVIFSNHETSAAVLAGFTISGADNNFHGSNNSNATIRNCALNDADLYTGYLSGGSGINLINNSYTGNDTEAILVAGGTADININYTNDGLPYHFIDDVAIWSFAGNPIPRLTIDPGTVLKFDNNVGIQIGNSSNRGGEIHAIGTIGDPVLFTAITPGLGDWGGLSFANGSDYLTSESILEYCEFEYAGEPLYGQEAAILLDYTQQPTINECTISNTSGYAMYLTNGAHPAAISNLTVTGNTNNTIAVGGFTYSVDQTFGSGGVPFEIIGDLAVWAFNGNPIPRLTIEPGNTLLFSDETDLEIGNSSDRGGELYAVGTFFDPIVFDAASGISGSWDGLIFKNGSDWNASSTMEFCIVSNAGGGGNGVNSGLQVDDSDEPTVINCQFNDNDGYPIYFTGLGYSSLSGLEFNNNTYNAIGFAGRNQQTDLTITAQPYPYHVLGSFQMWNFGTGDNPPRLTLEPGVELLFDIESGLRIGDSSNRWGELFAEGTFENPIIFGAINGLPGGWGGVEFDNGSDYIGSTSILDYCNIMDAGYALWGGINSTLILDNTDQPTVSNCDFSNSSGYPIYVHSTAHLSISNSTFADNALPGIAFEGRTMSSDYTLEAASVPYYILGDISVNTNVEPYPTLTLEPGTMLDFEETAHLRIGLGGQGGMLNAVGTEEAQITFGAISGEPGGWSGIYFDNGSDAGAAQSTMEWCVVRQGGFLGNLGFQANMYCFNTSQPTMLNTSFLNSSTDGLILDNYSGVIEDCRASSNDLDGIVAMNSQTHLVRVEMAANGDDGISLDNSEDTQIGSTPTSTCTMFNNTGYNVNVIAGADTVWARYNYWGSLDPVEIEASIFDFSDNPALGVVEYDPAVDVGVAANVFVTLTPDHDPTVIGPGGGYYGFNAQIENQDEFTAQLDAWSEYILPGDIVYGPIDLFEGITLPAGFTLDVNVIEEIPWYAPEGTYQFVVKIGDYPEAIDSSSFEIVKIELPLANNAFTEWNSHGWFGSEPIDKEALINELEVEMEILPTNYEISEVYPNPFNPMAKVRISLPQASQLTVKVYNITGQEVVTIYQGMHDAGIHNLTFNANGLASGIYFVRASVPGHLNQVQKVMLLR